MSSMIFQTSRRRLLAHLFQPHFAFSRAVDQAAQWLILDSRIRSFSIVPPIIVQAKVTASDIDKGADGKGSAWREGLEDGVLTGPGGEKGMRTMVGGRGAFIEPRLRRKVEEEGLSTRLVGCLYVRSLCS